MNLDYEEPNIELISFKPLPADGFEQNFEIGLKLTNPNNFELPINGISYQLSVAGETLAHGVSADIPTIGSYSEARFVVPISTSLLGGISVIKALMDTKGKIVVPCKYETIKIKGSIVFATNEGKTTTIKL